jgi:transposase-like protein
MQGLQDVLPRSRRTRFGVTRGLSDVDLVISDAHQGL